MGYLYFASDYAYGINPLCGAAIVVQGTTTGGVGTLVLNKPSIVTENGRTVNPAFNTNAPILVGTGSVAETVTPTGVATVFPQGVCAVTANFTYAHGQGTTIASATVGLQEALNDALARTNGGMVIIDGRWSFLGGTSAMIASATQPNNTQIADQRGGASAASQPVITLTGTADALNPHSAAQYLVTTGSADNMTLAAPSNPGDEGKTIQVISNTAFAHKITTSGLLNTGAAAVNVATFAAFAGASVTLRATSGKWTVLNSVGVTFT